MRWETGTATVGGSAVQIKSSDQRVRAIAFITHNDNAGRVILGRDDVTSTAGFGLNKGGTHTLVFDEPDKPGSEAISAIHIHGTVPGDKIDWSAILSG